MALILVPKVVAIAEPPHVHIIKIWALGSLPTLITTTQGHFNYPLRT